MQAAVPEYVSRHGFADCPPGHRFNLYFPLWDAAWGAGKEGAKPQALRQSLAVGHAVSALTALRQRQLALAEALPAGRSLIVDAVSTSPFSTGLGLEHPIENGFAFLTPYGLPYLAGSGIKGVLRRAAEELRVDDAPGFTDPLIDALFGPENAEQARRGALSFWDVFPEPAGGKMAVEIMTPHMTHYLQPKKGERAATPHESGKPNPIPFLAVPVGSRFRFVVVCEPTLLGTAEVPDWQAVVHRLAGHAFDWLGFGAKTAVGYGALKVDEAMARQREAERKRRADEAQALAERLRQQAERERKLSAMSPAERRMQEFFDARTDKNQSEFSVLFNGMKQGKMPAEDRAAIAQHLEKLLRAQGKWREKSEKKNPDKDSAHQDTLLIKKWLAE
jgi:CRISPR-associated protein Cmr6